jgi:antitoxin (DNA-binding transcriptional repressor) of toxin-antitoxin stability system
MQQFEIDEAQVHLKDLIDDAIEGKEVYILKDDQQMVRLVPVEPPKRHPQFGSAKDLVEMTDDFDAPLKDFREYVS